MEYILETHNLLKTYGVKRAVDNVTVHVKKGDIYGLIGKNGAGKTTLMKLILGLAVPKSGNITLFGSDKLNEERARIGSLIEAPGLYKSCSAYENMLRFSILYGADRSEIEGLLELVGLSDTGKKKAGAFSLGMKQRLGIAIALLAHPEVLVLDEPVNGLDPAGIKDVRDLIIELNKNRGVTFIISSHLIDELAKVATCYGIMNNGKLVEEISADLLQEKCSRHLKIVCNDNAGAVSLLKNFYGDLNAELKDDGINIYSHIHHAAEINSLLVKEGYAVSELAVAGNDMENYFIERLGA